MLTPPPLFLSPPTHIHTHTETHTQTRTHIDTDTDTYNLSVITTMNTLWKCNYMTAYPKKEYGDDPKVTPQVLFLDWVFPSTDLQ